MLGTGIKYVHETFFHTELCFLKSHVCKSRTAAVEAIFDLFGFIVYLNS